MCVLALSASALTGCEDPAVEVGVLGKKLSAPALKGTSPFDQSFSSQNYVHITGSCDTRVGDVSVSFKIGSKTGSGSAGTSPTSTEIANAAMYHTPSSSPDLTGTSLTGPIVNDVNCADGVFDFYLTKNDLLSVWGFDGTSTNIDVTVIYIKGSTLIGDTQVLTLTDPKGSNGSGGNVATKIAVEKQWPHGFAGSGRCEGFNVFLTDANNNWASSSAPVTFSLSQAKGGSAATTVFGYSSWETCNSSLINPIAGVSSFTIPAGQNSIQIMIPMPSDVGSLDQTFSISAISSGLNSATADSYILRNSASSRRWLTADSPGNNRIYKDICYPTKFSRYNYTGSYETTDAAIDVTPISANAKLKYFNDASCTNQTTTFSIPASIASVSGYVKYVSDANDTASSLRIPITFANTNANYDFASYRVDVDLSASATVTRVDFWGPNYIQRGYCSSYRVVRANNYMTPIPDPGSSLTVSLSSTASGTFYPYSGCTGTPLSQVTIGYGSADTEVYFKPDGVLTPGTYTVTASAPGLTSMVRDMKVTAASATNYTLNQLFGSVLAQDTCSAMKIYTYDSNSNPSSDVPISILYYSSGLSIATDVQLYRDPSCSTAITQNTATTLTSSGSQYYMVYIKSTALTGSSFSLNLQVNFETMSQSQAYNIYLSH